MFVCARPWYEGFAEQSRAETATQRLKFSRNFRCEQRRRRPAGVVFALRSKRNSQRTGSACHATAGSVVTPRSRQAEQSEHVDLGADRGTGTAVLASTLF